MLERGFVMAALLCSACAKGGTLSPDDGTSPPASPGDPATVASGSTTPAGSVTKPSGDPPDAGTPATGTGGTPPADAGAGPSGGEAQAECEAIWAITDHFGCAAVELICLVLEDVKVGAAKVPCDIAIPLACGLASADADAAAAACHP